MIEENFDKSKKQIKELYKDMESIVKMNPGLYIMPRELYDRIMNRLGHMEDRIKKQTQSLRRHISEKQELTRRSKKS